MGNHHQILCCFRKMLFSLTKEENTLGNKKNLGILTGLEFDLCIQSRLFPQSLLLDKNADQLCGFIMGNLTCFCIIK